ncbi:MAG: hypothetical protein KA250_18675 [Verrucomicrobiales bacterium]|nr:hypothetical protein [Verrucomicrobiales bacterium]MBP9226290.1 hypothetical protein [Verrucomicrobiales bacterium]
MKRPRRPRLSPDPLVARAELIPERYRCAATNHHVKPSNKWDYLEHGLLRIRRHRPDSRPLSPAYLSRVTAAIRDHLRLLLVYEDAQGRVTERHIVPMHWVVPGDRFTAHCELREADRDFRVHRFLDCQFAPPETSAPSPSPSPEEAA